MNRKTLASDRRRRKVITTLWMLGVAVVIGILIYREMTAVLYIFATLGVTLLLILVAWSDLSHSGGSTEQVGQSKDASGIANRLS
jgi:hypothetical protein